MPGLGLGLFLAVTWLAGIFHRDIRWETVELDGPFRIVIHDFTYGLGPDSACRQLEVRSGSGILERRRLVGRCPQLKYVERWTYRARGDILIIQNGEALCTYRPRHDATLAAIEERPCEWLLGSME
ncbi:MAG: hypothetical protein ACKV2O_17365 [Acidimicrobiales bacterium]